MHIPTSSRAVRMGQTLLWGLASAVALYALLAHSLWPAGVFVGAAMQQVYQLHPLLIHTHAGAAGLALLLGPWQFSRRLRTRRPRLHRVVGRLYLGAGIVLGGLSGLALSRLAQGGWVAQLGFACLALAWLYSGWRGYVAIRRGERVQHRRWMLRNHALTLAAVSLRIYVGVTLAAGWPFDTAYAVIAWLCWLPHLVIAQWWLRRDRGDTTGGLSTMT